MALYDIPEEGSISYPDDVICPPELLDRHYHCNSDAFPHYFSKGIRNIPDEVLELQAEYYRSDEFFKD